MEGRERLGAITVTFFSFFNLWLPALRGRGVSKCLRIIRCSVSIRHDSFHGVSCRRLSTIASGAWDLCMAGRVRCCLRAITVADHLVSQTAMVLLYRSVSRSVGLGGTCIALSSHTRVSFVWGYRYGKGRIGCYIRGWERLLCSCQAVFLVSTFSNDQQPLDFELLPIIEEGTHAKAR